MLTLDPWQKEFLAHDGNKILVSGRQTGKSEAAGYDNGEFILNNAGATALIISKTERQAEELLIKTMNYILEKAPKRIGKGKLKPLKHCVWVTHGKQKPSRVMCLPTGIAGEGIKGLTINKLTVDEAQLPEDEVFYNILPMLLTTGGHISLIGTPRGKKGFFWKAFNGELGEWRKWHINSEEVITKRPISENWPDWRRQAAIQFLEAEKKRLPEKWFQQEYGGIFIEPVDRLFSGELLKDICIGKRRDRVWQERDYYIGVDVGRTIDPSTFEILDRSETEHIDQVESLVRKDYPITKTAEEVERLIKEYRPRKCGLDGGGIGAGVVDILLANTAIASKIIDLNNAKRAYEYGETPGKTKLLKADMYLTLLTLMYQKKITLLDDPDVIASLESVHIEYKEGKDEPIIVALDNHIVEGIVRAAYLAVKDKSFKLWCEYL